MGNFSKQVVAQSTFNWTKAYLSQNYEMLKAIDKHTDERSVNNLFEMASSAAHGKFFENTFNPYYPFHSIYSPMMYSLQPKKISKVRTVKVGRSRTKEIDHTLPTFLDYNKQISCTTIIFEILKSKIVL